VDEEAEKGGIDEEEVLGLLLAFTHLHSLGALSGKENISY
jgi:hypothetical protein